MTTKVPQHMDIYANLSSLLPLAIAWAEHQSKLICETGFEITESHYELARTVGVKKPEKIRILVVPSIPTPQEDLLKSACTQLNFLGPDSEGLTLSYGIFIRTGAEDNRKLLAHEFRHVAQYEEHPSIASYLSAYIPQILQYGYNRAPLELDAETAAERWA